MIPSVSLFSHLRCGFGSQCDRPYCSYSHRDTEMATMNYSIDAPTMKAYNFGQQSENYNEFGYQSHFDPINQTPVDDFPAYIPIEQQARTYMPANVNNNSMKQPKKRKHQASENSFLPVDLGNDEILLSLSASHNQPEEKKVRREPIPTVNPIPGNSKAYSSSSPFNKRAKTSIDNKLPAATNAFKSTLRAEKEGKIATTSSKLSSSSLFVPTKASTVDKKLIAATNAVKSTIIAEKERKVAPVSSKLASSSLSVPAKVSTKVAPVSSNLSSSSLFVPTKVAPVSKESYSELPKKAPRIAHDQSFVRKNQITGRMKIPKYQISTPVSAQSLVTIPLKKWSNMPKKSNPQKPMHIIPQKQVPPIRQRSANPPIQQKPRPANPSINIEKELRVIEILEKKNQLLRDYKQLALEIAEIEASKPSYDFASIRSLFGTGKMLNQFRGNE